MRDVATALADAASGRPRVVSVEGDGGAGKTALARRSLADLAVEHRTVVLGGDELTAAIVTARPEGSGTDNGWARLRNDARRCVRVRVGHGAQRAAR